MLNRVYYGADFTMQEILFNGKLKPTQPAASLATKKNAGAKGDQ
ncbi:MAG TPA: hypothetical protein VNZ64_24690 [Candidatus Acidoferrum sp.]|jgi:hypothetical protein|nr:hypothetical protein [Candidatus Acidoferrum sp.]